MVSKKAVLILGLLAMVLLIFSEVTTRDLPDASPNSKKAEFVEETNEVNDAKIGRRTLGLGGMIGGLPGRVGRVVGGIGGRSPGRGVGGIGGRSSGRGRGPGLGSPYPGYGGGGTLGYGGGGDINGGCYDHACCERDSLTGGCKMCCNYASEAVAAQTEDNTKN